MAPLVPLGFALAHHRLSITGDPEEMLVTFGYDVSAYAGDDQAMANAIHNAFGAALDTSLTVQTTVKGVTLYLGGGAGAELIPVQSNNAAYIGTSSGSSLPPNTAVLVRKMGAQPGKRNRGRFFLPGFNEAGVEPSGALVSTNLTQLQTDCNAFMAALAAISVVPVILHPETAPDPTPTIVTSLVAQSKVATQRRRLR